MTRENVSICSQQEWTAQWTRGCVVMGLIAVGIWGVLSVQLCMSFRARPLDTCPQRINPNTASMGSLVRLDGIGRARAMDIIYYREHHTQDGQAFKSAEDMQQIRGIGPKTVEKNLPRLTFDAN